LKTLAGVHFVLPFLNIFFCKTSLEKSRPPCQSQPLQVHPPDKLAHYARACTDLEFTFPFGTQELLGVAARGNFDLSAHQVGP
jgi:glycyl-tRNA synthetase (class II)